MKRQISFFFMIKQAIVLCISMIPVYDIMFWFQILRYYGVKFISDDNITYLKARIKIILV